MPHHLHLYKLKLFNTSTEKHNFIAEAKHSFGDQSRQYPRYLYGNRHQPGNAFAFSQKECNIDILSLKFIEFLILNGKLCRGLWPPMIVHEVAIFYICILIVEMTGYLPIDISTRDIERGRHLTERTIARTDVMLINGYSVRYKF